MTTAFALAGGASLGAVEVGMLQALLERDIRPDLVVGTSAGALNSAYLAGRPDLDGVRRLGEVWRGLTLLRVFPPSPVDTALGLLGLGDHLVSSAGLRRIVRDNLTYGRLEEASLPVHVVATDVTSGLETLLSEGDTVDAVLASSAVPAVFPPVRVDGRALVDGAVADHTPVSQAATLGAERIYVLPTGFPCTLRRPPGSVLAVALQALVVVLSRRLALDVARVQDERDLRIVPPLCPLGVSPADFGQAGELIGRAYRSTVRWLDEGEPDRGQAVGIGPHRYPPDLPAAG